MTDDNMSTHRVHFRVDIPEGNRLEQWGDEPCECLGRSDHDLGEEVWDD